MVGCRRIFSNLMSSTLHIYMCRDILNIRLRHEAAWCGTFSCLRTSQTRDSAGFQLAKYPTREPAQFLPPAYHCVPHNRSESVNLVGASLLVLTKPMTAAPW
ncbi:LOW QUALITY PROTEIN: hypothetical protein T265_12670 [Opisthorchis viverrini]|uniref:Uncharacterized protein n=1 Tax=Opisthorchis viverrini TaxID=6198 RepID=A0A075AJE6_OPIVI|nr:LOW QUALITY PROTEIN: hypothetical protein T265_12670 [Opisthorchis viverrini]KER33249.1 LOW QUALITY PROTEIN: hypothetical protein T265_12670 [Opisthorchis viverrini]